MAAVQDPADGVSIEALLVRALPAPRYVKPASAAAIVSLAAHCLMLDAGYQQAEASAGPPDYVPAKDWNGKFQNEWVFNYVRDSCANRFVLHLSLQAVSGRMFVQCLEENNLSNIHNLGLQPAKYVSDTSKLGADSWAGVVENQDQLQNYITSYLITPLTREAVPGVQIAASTRGADAGAAAPPSAAVQPSAQSTKTTSSSSPAGGSSSADGRFPDEGRQGLVGPDSAVFSGLTRPLVLASTVAAAAAVAWIAWSRSGRG